MILAEYMIKVFKKLFKQAKKWKFLNKMLKFIYNKDLKHLEVEASKTRSEKDIYIEHLASENNLGG